MPLNKPLKPDSPKKAETGMDRLKKMPLGGWGAITIFAGLMANLIGGLMAPTGGSSRQRQAEALGRGVVTMLFVVIGIGLIVAHFVRRKRG